MILKIWAAGIFFYSCRCS